MMGTYITVELSVIELQTVKKQQCDSKQLSVFCVL